LCVPKLALPANLPVGEGSQASLQVVTVGDDGNALYNCADIVFTANATALAGDACTNTTGLTVTAVSPPKAGAGSAMGVNVVALTSVVALATVFALGMSL
jgi:uncharacterized phosphosugar-binding protein